MGFNGPSPEILASASNPYYNSAASSTSSGSEDHAVAILILCAASQQSRELPKEFGAWVKQRLAETCPNWVDESVANWPAFLAEQLVQLRAATFLPVRKKMNPLAAEFFAQALFRRLGIATGPAQILTIKKARELSAAIVKVVGADGILRWSEKTLAQQADSVHCLVCEQVQDAASLDYIWRKLITVPSRTSVEAYLTKHLLNFADFNRRCEKQIAGALRKECPRADVLFQSFKPNSDQLNEIWKSMNWFGAQYLRICAARILTGCSAPHMGNVLATLDGQLISIDHATAHFEPGEDLEMLFAHLNRKSLAFEIVGEIANLTEQDIRASIAEIPKHSACHEGGLADYFIKRLNCWKSLCSGRTSKIAVTA